MTAALIFLAGATFGAVTSAALVYWWIGYVCWRKCTKFLNTILPQRHRMKEHA